MATMSSAAGYQNLPVGNWAPAIYSQKVLKYFRRASVVEAITNTDYTGEIENFGDTVNIIKEPTITVKDYARGQTVNTENLDDNQIQLTIDQGSYFAFKVDDIEERQSHINFEALATSSGAYALKKNYDYNVLKYIFDNAVASTGTLGTQSTSANTGDEVANLVSQAAAELDKNDVPEENRWLVAAPQFYEVLRQAGSKIMDMSVTGGGASPLLNGRVTDGKLHGFDLYQSNAIGVGTTGSAATQVFGSSATSGQTLILYGHMSGVATASHIAKTEVIRDPDSFSDIVRGLHVYGRKVLRAESDTGFKGVFKGLMDLDS
tara:strand:+ start:3581 stop:4537 length:957 start_codon:yes stop_codon:yes gene_type:complete